MSAMMNDRYFFFFNDTATTEIYTLSLHDALPIWLQARRRHPRREGGARVHVPDEGGARGPLAEAGPLPHRRERRSEEHTSELQSRQYLVCRLLLEKKKTPTLLPPYSCVYHVSLSA